MEEMNLTPADLAMFEHLRISPRLLEQARIERVTDREARDRFGINGYGDKSGIVFHYFDPMSGHRWTARLRRDNPEVEGGKPRNKYLSAYGDRKHLYFPPGCAALLADVKVPVVLVEAEKSVLALTEWAGRTETTILPIGLGGCWGWRGRIGKETNASGKAVDEVGPLPDLVGACEGRKVHVLLDANAAGNPKVQAARAALVRQLRKQNADVHILDLPTGDGINGPDDFIAVRGDQAMRTVLESGRLDWGQRLVRNAPTREQAAAGAPGTPKAVLANALVALREALEWQGVLAYDEFSLHAVAKKPAPWQTSAGANWTDFDDSMTAEWLQLHGILVNSAVAAEAVQTVAKENPFHPVRNYLTSLTWDQQPRVDQWLVDYLGAENTPYIRAIGKRWLVSAVGRIFQPGCQVDYTLMLEGPQGTGKSTALRVLAGDKWFTDHLSDLGSKDSRLELHGRWIIELAELDRVRRGELEKVKAFLTTRIDLFRQPYGRRTEAVPRSCVFAGSTNDDTPFTDETGNRRFWPVRCGNINIDNLTNDRDQLWAEAYKRFQDDHHWWLDTPELREDATREQDERYAVGVWDDEILRWVDDPKQRSAADGEHRELVPIEPFDSTRDRVSVIEILLHAIGKPLDRCRQSDQNQVVKCLKKAKWTRGQERAGPLRGKRFYYRPTDGTT
jgi:predicted P-loop ATPase